MEIHIDFERRRIRAISYLPKQVKWLVSDSISIFFRLDISTTLCEDMTEHLIVEPDHIRKRKQLV